MESKLEGMVTFRRIPRIHWSWCGLKVDNPKSIDFWPKLINGYIGSRFKNFEYNQSYESPKNI